MKRKLSLMILSLIITFSSVFFLGCNKNQTRKSTQTQETEFYRCPMHPQVRSDQPGECPICHMKLEKVQSGANLAAESTSQKKIKYYRNPMDPSIHSDQPAKDSMGMDYIPVYENEKAMDASDDEKESGRGTFSLTPEQLKLSGTKEVLVENQDLNVEIRISGRVLDRSHLSFQAFEQDSAFIKFGMEFEAETPMAPGQILMGKITFVDSMLDPMTRTIRIDGVISSPSQVALRTEASVVGKLKIKITNALSIPEEAVLHTGTHNFVYVSDGQGAFSPRIVVLGIKANGRYEIKSGLNVGEKISAGPNFLLDSESRIESFQ